MKKIKIITFFCFISLISIVQCMDRPRWINDTPEGYVHDFFVGVGTSTKSEADARSAALANALFRVVQSGSVIVEGVQSLKSTSSENFHDGSSIEMSVVDTIISEIRIYGNSTTVKGLSEEEYFAERNGATITVWSLIKIPKVNPRKEMPPQKSDAIWRSVVVPSWGQFYKGEETKGFIIASSIAVCIPAGIIMGSMKGTAEVDALNARTQALRDYYTDQANTYNSVQIACYSLAGAMYVYNIIDAVVSSGEKVYVESNQPTIAPRVALHSGNIGFGFEVRF